MLVSIGLILLVYLCMCICTSADPSCYLAANTTCCIFGCLLPGKGELRECHIYCQHVADLRVLWLLSNNIYIFLLRCQCARWIFAPLLCVCKRAARDMASQFQLVKYCGQLSMQADGAAACMAVSPHKLV